jgi:hypothetical protein
LQQLTGENVVLNGGAVITGDLWVPGTPTVRCNGSPQFSGAIDSSGGTLPSNYRVTLNGNCRLRHVVRRVDPVNLTAVQTPQSPAGTRSVTIHQPGQSPGDFTTVKDLTLNGNVGLMNVPPGAYGRFTANGGSGFVLGTSNSSQAAIYHFQSLTLNGQTQVQLAGPVELRVANGFTANGWMGSSNQASWLVLKVAGGGLTLNGGCELWGQVIAPQGHVVLNGNSLLAGTVQCDRLTLNGGGVLQYQDNAGLNTPPVPLAQTLDVLEDIPLPITLTGSDADHDPLTFAVTIQPTNGILTGTAPDLIYTPNPNFNGTDTFFFICQDPSVSSVPSVVNLSILSVNDSPVAHSQSLTNLEDIPLPITLTGSDVDHDPLTFAVTIQPTNGILTGIAPDLIYTPNPNFNGTDTFFFVSQDPSVSSVPSVVNLSILAIQPPDGTLRALDQWAEVEEDSWGLALTLMGYDVTGTGIINFKLVRPPKHGTAYICDPWDGIHNNSVGANYTPNVDFHGLDSFTFTVSDGVSASAEATVHIRILSINDAPVVENFNLITGADRSIAFQLQGNDVENDALSFILITPPQHGSVTLDEPSSTTASIKAGYVAEAGYSGSDTFIYRAFDGQDYSAEATVDITAASAPGLESMRVEAGPNQRLDRAGNIALAGSVWIPSPVSDAPTNATWSLVTGPKPIQFHNPNSLTTAAAITEPGTYVILLSVEHAGSWKRDTLTVEVLAQGTSAAAQVRSNRGTDFWLAMLENSRSGYEPSKAGVSVMIAAEVDTTGRISWKNENFEPKDQAFQVRAGVPALINLIDYWGAPDYDSDTILADAIHVTAANPVTVFQLNYSEYSTDGYTALPTSMLGREHVVLAYGNEWLPWFQDSSGNPSLAEGTQFAVVGVQNQTTVTITPSLSSTDRPAGVPYQIELHTGETYRMIDETTPGGDFSGTLISSDKPVAVFGGHKSTSLPRGLFGYSDHLEEQLPPVDLWGQRYLTLPLATRRNGDTFRVIAARDATEVCVNGAMSARLNRGQWHEFILTNASEITASQPVLLAQFAQSTAYDGITGDPFMMVLPAMERYGCSYLLSTTSEFD